MTKILFVCHGNICRSPMAHCIFTQMIKEEKLEKLIQIDSKATSTDELGSGIYPPARRKLHEKGVPLIFHYATQIESEDYYRFDHIIGMDSANIRNMNRIAEGDAEGKIYKMLSFAGYEKNHQLVAGRDVADPWYTGDFATTYRDVLKGCQALLAQLTE